MIVSHQKIVRHPENEQIHKEWNDQHEQRQFDGGIRKRWQHQFLDTIPEFPLNKQCCRYFNHGHQTNIDTSLIHPWSWSIWKMRENKNCFKWSWDNCDRLISYRKRQNWSLAIYCNTLEIGTIESQWSRLTVRSLNPTKNWSRTMCMGRRGRAAPNKRLSNGWRWHQCLASMYRTTTLATVDERLTAHEIALLREENMKFQIFTIISTEFKFNNLLKWVIKLIIVQSCVFFFSFAFPISD